MQQIIVDGYNVVHADASRSSGARALDNDRMRLIDQVVRYVATRDVRVTIVFDGAGRGIGAEVVLPGKVQVLYSRRGQTADELIVSTLERHTNPREYIIVTNDMADIGRRVRQMGASVMRSEDFLSRILKGAIVDDNHAPSREKPDAESVDIDYWLREFGETDDNADTDK